MSNELIDPLILAIETATRAGSVSLARGMRVHSSVSGDASSSHSNDLIENIETVLRDGGVDLHAVDVFAAANGPGSFTGLRIGLATVKAFAMSTRRKCVGISTLAAIALAAGNSDRSVAVLPAGRGEVFAQMFAVRDRDITPLDEATHLSPELLLARYSGHQQLLWAGEGAHSQLERLQREAEARGVDLASSPQSNGWSIAALDQQLARAVANLAEREWRAGHAIDPENLHANYLRASDAELNAHA